VPDPVSFAAYGLAWGRVQPASRAALEGLPRGPALPHAATGRPLGKVAPPRLPAPAPGAARDLDPRLGAALRLIEGYPPTASWPDFLARYGVALRFGPVAGAPATLAAYRAEGRTLTVGEQHAGLAPGVLATLIVHEMVHALYDANRATGKSGRACIDEEVEAFATQAAFWAHLHGPAGMPAPGNAVEQELNRVLQAALDDALAATVITTFAYTIRCYFPEVGAGPPSE
jgi:hypothetical protein